MTLLITTPDRDSHGAKDFSYAFRPDSEALARLYSDSVTVRIDLSQGKPARQRQLPAGLFQRHYVGGRDRLVPEGVVRRGPIDGNSVRVVPDCDHDSCWKALWPAILEEVRRGVGGDG